MSRWPFVRAERGPKAEFIDMVAEPHIIVDDHATGHAMARLPGDELPPPGVHLPFRVLFCLTARFFTKTKYQEIVKAGAPVVVIEDPEIVRFFRRTWVATETHPAPTADETICCIVVAA